MPDLATIPELFQATTSRAGDREAFGMLHDGEVKWKTWQNVAQDVERVMAGLASYGVGAGDRVVQYAPNSYEWIVTDLGILRLGAVHVPIHASLPIVQAKEQCRLADPKLVVLPQENRELRAGPVAAATHAQLLDHPRTSPQSEFRIPNSNDLATILFTSGTTGEPRGVMLSHANLATNAVAVTRAIGSSHEETRLCFLPLSHIYARTCDLYTWVYRGSRIVLAQSRDTILSDCQRVKPTVINGVPYFYQKVAQSIRANGQENDPGILQHLLGGQMRLCCCGGAPVAPEVENLFSEQGLPLLSGYGLTEASPVVSASSKQNYRPGCVGPPIEGVDVKLAEDDEILVHGPNVMLGYWRDPTTTSETIVDGWLHTGDLGAFEDGILRIVGRKKELLVLSTGKKICPSAIEQRLAGSPYIENACVVGDGRSHVGAIVVPNPQALKRFIKEKRLWVWSKRRAVTHPKVRALFRDEIDRTLRDVSREERVGPFTILSRNFLLETGEITPKFSLCREVIARHLAGQIEAMYGGVSSRRNRALG